MGFGGKAGKDKVDRFGLEYAPDLWLAWKVDRFGLEFGQLLKWIDLVLFMGIKKPDDCHRVVVPLR